MTTGVIVALFTVLFGIAALLAMIGKELSNILKELIRLNATVEHEYNRRIMRGK